MTLRERATGAAGAAFAVAAALTHAAAWAQSTNPPVTTASSTASTAASSIGTNAPASPVFGMMQGVFGLLVVLGLVFAAGWLMKRIGPRARSTGIVQVVGGASVGPREKVVVVRFGAQTLLLGVAPGHVGLLRVADAGELVDDAAPVPDAPSTSFVERLRAATSTRPQP